MRKIKRGTLGWNDGCAFVILSRMKTRYGAVYVIAVCDPGEPKRVWLEAMMEKTMRRQSVIGPDCDGTLPERKWFWRYFK